MANWGVRLTVLLIALPALAQQSASFKLTESVLNAGGDPAEGVVLMSVNHKITLDAVGDSVASLGSSSPSFRMDGGFPSGFPPPGEVRDLGFSNLSVLVWSPERSVGGYNLYRAAVSGLPDLEYGTCLLYDLIHEIAYDADEPSSGEGYFYLVTAKNRLNEEGTKGWHSGGFTRANDNPCP